VAEGVCIRLYSEADYNARPRFTQPEIQRANLADVILRMKAFGLGDIERFPFINMPATKAIRAGYALLEELGAIERTESAKADGTTDTQGRGAESFTHELTPVGRVLARLPIDPTVGRMILQARGE
jgi:ATP-dependent helicase HrpA